MPRLLAITLPPGPAFVDELVAAWTAGDAVAPLDPRLPPPAAAAMLGLLRPTVVVDQWREHVPWADGVPVETGDALVVATSGTTGQPRAAVLSRAAVEAAARASSERLAVDAARDRWLAVLPVAHVGGLGVVTRALLTATPLSFDWEDPTATLTAVVPTQANRHDLSRFRKVLVGGSADWRERPANVVHTYGLTETGGGVVYDGVPLEGVEVQVGSDGQILVRGPMLLRAYRDGTDPRLDGGWLATGDAGSVDGHGRLVVHGRLDDMIVTGGEKVWPVTVERALRDHPAVADVAVAGRPDPEWGMRVVAWVVPPADGPPPDLQDLRRHVKATLPAHAAPRELRLVSGLPRTGIGKVQHKLLQ
ncbi:MAG: AMP-binding protein [Actinobacteria bacterium]|nr:AMP-binding protein [Actinomycetota bacterium]MBW3650830.1 AMP-binding protein [Actinomycetota bacterium]